MVLEVGGSRPLVHPNKISRFSSYHDDLLEWRGVIASGVVAPLAQLVEQRTLNPLVESSNLSRPTNIINLVDVDTSKMLEYSHILIVFECLSFVSQTEFKHFEYIIPKQLA